MKTTCQAGQTSYMKVMAGSVAKRALRAGLSSKSKQAALKVMQHVFIMTAMQISRICSDEQATGAFDMMIQIVCKVNKEAVSVNRQSLSLAAQNHLRVVVRISCFSESSHDYGIGQDRADTPNDIPNQLGHAIPSVSS